MPSRNVPLVQFTSAQKSEETCKHVYCLKVITLAPLKWKKTLANCKRGWPISQYERSHLTRWKDFRNANDDFQATVARKVENRAESLRTEMTKQKIYKVAKAFKNKLFGALYQYFDKDKDIW